MIQHTPTLQNLLIEDRINFPDLKHLLYNGLELSSCIPTKVKSGRTTSETSALQTQYISFIILFSASKTYVMVFLVSDQVLDPT